MAAHIGPAMKRPKSMTRIPLSTMFDPGVACSRL
jgi:hypothetical protein